ncbi:MAG TPA: dynamin family protein [Blastocatellia bacterium]|nr:dynamin family protein [Blastocatellia bacterium]
MHKGNIEAAGRETLRLLNYTLEVLNKHLAAEDLVHEEDPEQQRQLDRKKARLWKDVLRNEIRKVENLETVLAVIGTTSAGKSLTINAIVGAEILPSRPDPMTTYPTLVRHKTGQKEPILHFPLAHNFIELGKAAKARIQDLMQNKPLDEIFPHIRERQSAEHILSGKFESLTETYIDREPIFQLLEIINDLYRVCAPLDISLPAVADDGGAALPVIEVEMFHVGTVNQEHGQFTILDSPGPDDFRQGDRLRDIVRRQLSQASAVLLICDFTHLNTDADKEIQELVEEVLAQLTDRVFIFVNKFDQRGARDWGAEEVRKYLSHTLLDGDIPPSRIFPVSARSAFRANWAKRELKLRGHLPEPPDHNTEDFGSEALGTLWKRFIRDNETTREAAEALWRNSLFDEPLEMVIRAAAANAAIISLKSAIAKVVEYNRVLDRFLKIRATAATTSAETLQSEITGLQSDVSKTGKAYDIALDHMKEMVEFFSSFVDVVCQNASDDVGNILDEYFKTGKIMQLAKDKSAERHSLLRQLLTKIGEKFSPLVETAEKQPGIDLKAMAQDFDPATGFDSKTGTYVLRGHAHANEAKALVARIRKSILDVFLAVSRATQTRLASASATLSNQLWADIDSNLKDVLESAEQRLKRSFDITFTFPKPNLEMSETVFRDYGTNVVRQKAEKYERYVERKGVAGKVKRWFADFFGERWGYDKIQETREVSTINLGALRDQANQKLGVFKYEMQRQAENFVSSVLRESVDSYFDDLKKYIEAFRGDLLDALSDKNLEKDRLQALYETIKKLKSEVDDLLHDGTSLKTALEAI